MEYIKLGFMLDYLRMNYYHSLVHVHVLTMVMVESKVDQGRKFKSLRTELNLEMSV